MRVLPRLLRAGLLALLAMAALAPSAAASVEWCADDPILVVEGRQARITTTFASAELGTLTGPVSYELFLPANVRATVVAPPDAAVPDQVTVTRTAQQWTGGPIPVSVRVTVPSPDTFPVTVTVSGPGLDATVTALGMSGQTTSLDFTLTR